jgi:hypothetical protein
LFLCFWGSNNIFNSPFFVPNDIKNVQFGYKMKENLKLFDDRVLFGDMNVYPSYNPITIQLKLK